MSDKDKEKVLVIKTKVLFPDGVWSGFKSLDENSLVKLIEDNKEYIERGKVETDDSYQQVITRILLSCGSKIFYYLNSKASGEKRLHDMWEIFLGGHINDSDLSLKDAIDREFVEEIKYNGNIINKKFLGVVKLDDNPVNKVHVGLVYNYVGDSYNFENTEDGSIAQGKFIEFSDLETHLDELTYWPKVVYPYLNKLVWVTP